MRKALLLLVITCTWTVCVGAGAFGEEPLGAGNEPSDYGSGTNFLVVPADKFISSRPETGCFWSSTAAEGFYSIEGAHCAASAAVDLPAGALLTGVTFLYRDASAASMSALMLRVKVQTDGTLTDDIIFDWISEGTPGVAVETIAIEPNHTVSYFEVGLTTRTYAYYRIFVYTPLDRSAQLGAVVLRWQRQVSPAPATATFSDVPTTHPYFRFVEALATAGITGGCGGGLYCPNNPVTRGQMAVFLASALGLYWHP